MNRRNYRRELDRITSDILQEKRPKVLLQACCGPCSSSVLEYLTRYFDITVLWYNPNIYPEEEFNKRRETLLELLDKAELRELVKTVLLPWSSVDYNEAVQGLESEPEGGKRCAVCFRVRLQKTAVYAAANGFDYFCTTLTVSRHKNAELINNIGEQIAKETGVAWLPSDFKKRGGEDRSQQLSKQYGLYQQHYCGCRFSLKGNGGSHEE